MVFSSIRYQLSLVGVLDEFTKESVWFLILLGVWVNHCSNRALR